MASAIISETIRPAYIWTGEEWVQIGDGGAAGGSSSVIYSPEQPDTTDLEPGALWMDSDSEPASGGVATQSFKFIQTIPETELIIANSSTDTLNIEAGSNINISAASATNTLNIEFNTSSLDVYLTTESASTTYATKEELEEIDLSPYLTIESASATYEPDIPYTSASPVMPAAGTLWVDATDNEKPTLKVYNGIEWIAVSGAPSESGFHPFFGGS
jgi:hypothetical protein